MTWLTRTPLVVVNAHAAMLDRLMAEEALLGSTITAVGTRTLKREKSRAHLLRWERMARPRQQRASRPATPTTLQALGIGQRAARRNDG